MNVFGLGIIILMSLQEKHIIILLKRIKSSFYLHENEQMFAHSRPVHYENDFEDGPVNYSEN
jgi:hypothetical protein